VCSKDDCDAQLARRGERLVEFWDALGLASFTVTGVAVALSQGLDPLWLWGPLFGALTAADGGVIRDVVRSKLAGTLTTSFYAEVAVLWGLAISIWLTLQGVELGACHFIIAAVLTVVGAAATRMVAWYTGFGPILFLPRLRASRKSPSSAKPQFARVYKRTGVTMIQRSNGALTHSAYCR